MSNVVLTDEALGIGSRFGFYDDFVDERELNRDIYERRASRTTDAALTWLATRRDAENPSFLWVHYIDPHGPYDPPPDEAPVTFGHEGTVGLDNDKLPFYQRLAGIDDGLTYIDRYDGEIAYTDQEVGRLLDGYLELGLLDEAIVILTADHGDNMIEHEAYFDHTYHVWDSMLRIPLMIRWPDLPGARITTTVSLVDLTPTLLDHLGLPLRRGMDGRPLEQRQFGDLLFQEAATLNRGSQPRSVIQGESKWIAFASGKREIVGNLFLNLREDPAELRVTPWPGTGSEAAAQLAELIRLDPDPGGIPEDRLAGRPLTEPKFRNELEPHEIEALRSLGYIR